MHVQAAQQDSARNERLSYKFQRLREQLRQAIATGEFKGRLPGERDLGRRFCANAKTINKALSDLSAEGLVVRHIGRGTFVTLGEAPAMRAGRSYWWVTRPENDEAGLRVYEAAARRLTSAETNDALTPISIHDLGWQHESIRRRGLRETDGVVLCGTVPDDSVMSELMRRHVPTVLIDGELEAPRVDTVLADDADAGFRLTEHLFQVGCSRVFVVASAVTNRGAGSDGRGDTAVVDRVFTGYHAACRRRRVSPERAISPSDLGRVVDGSGPVGFLSIGMEATKAAAVFRSARQRRGSKENGTGSGASRDVAQACFLNSGDRLAEMCDITAYEVPCERLADWAVRLLREWRIGHPPVQVVVPGRLIVRGSTGEPASVRERMTVPAEAII